jgi:hypothetical protein
MKTQLSSDPKKNRGMLRDGYVLQPFDLVWRLTPAERSPKFEFKTGWQSIEENEFKTHTVRDKSMFRRVTRQLVRTIFEIRGSFVQEGYHFRRAIGYCPIQVASIVLDSKTSDTLPSSKRLGVWICGDPLDETPWHLTPRKLSVMHQTRT